MEKPPLLTLQSFSEMQFQDVLHFLGHLSILSSGPEVHPGDLCWWMFQSTLFDPKVSIQIFRSVENQIQAVLFADPPDWISLTVHPECRALEQVLDAAEQHAIKHQKSKWTIRVGSASPLCPLLLDRGYSLSDSRSVWMVHQPPLTSPAVLPEGYTLSNMQEFKDPIQRVQIHQKVWKSERFTLEALQRVQSCPVYDPALDLLIIGPDGTVAGSALVWFDALSRTGTFEPVGVHPKHQGKGLGKVLMAAGVAALQERGPHKTTVSTRESNLKAVQLYEKLGFRTSGSFLNFERVQQS